jgi:pyridoxal phosphate enzyme (YggS family)
MMTLTIADRLAQVRHRLAEAALRGGRSPEAVTLVGVCKMADRPAIDEAYAAGLRHFGENRVQEAQAKFGAGRPADLVLHLIGHLQTNKARDAVRLFQVIESAESTRLLDELDRQAARAGLVVPVLLEVNIGGEASKQGVTAGEAEALAAHAFARPHLQPRGLMTVAPLVDDAEAVRPVFAALRGLRDHLCERHNDWSLPDLSMGMTNDFEVAIEEGATIIRVGRAIFAA